MYTIELGRGNPIKLLYKGSSAVLTAINISANYDIKSMSGSAGFKNCLLANKPVAYHP